MRGGRIQKAADRRLIFGIQAVASQRSMSASEMAPKTQRNWNLVDHVAYLGDDDWILWYYLVPCIARASKVTDPYIVKRILVGTMVEVIVNGLVVPGHYVDGKGFVPWNLPMGDSIVKLQLEIAALDPDDFCWNPAFDLTQPGEDLARQLQAGLPQKKWTRGYAAWLGSSQDRR